MLTRRSSLAARSKILLFMPLAVVCLFCIPTQGFSQKTAAAKIAITPFGINDTAAYYTVTYDQILANPTIVCNTASCTLVSFTISFLPKGQDFMGPFKIDGATRITQLQLDLLKKLKDDKVTETRIFIENVQVSCNGKIVNLSPKLLKAKL